ncbi:MAG: hypothetical protein V2I33_26245, partial [Kangiellaceae bacterium]|nr:hypothetical protein [Kangiellaceae bacterium]
MESNLGLSSDGYYIYQTLMFCVTIVSGLIAIAILNLIAFHVLLKFKGMTTFEYMVQNGRKVAPSTNELVSQSFNGLNDST